MSTHSRRDLLRLAVTLPLGATFTRFKALAQKPENKVKITDIKAKAIKNIAA